MRPRILLIGYNFHPEPTGIGKYSGEMIQWLAAQGHECAVITAYPYYPHWKVQEPYVKNRFFYQKEVQEISSGGKISIYRCPMYIPSKPSGLKRLLLDFSFLLTALLQLIKLLPQPKFDYVITIAPSFQFGLLGALYKHLRASKFVYHIQDLQIEAARDLHIIKSQLVIRTLFAFERFIFRKADVVSTVSEEMVRRVRQKSGKGVYLFSNWTNISSFYPIENRNELKAEFGFSPSDKLVLYSGAIGEKQGLESILSAAQTFRAQKHVKFIICGSGPYQHTLQELATKLTLSNVIFLPVQPLHRFNGFLNIADVHLVLQKASASDLVMPSKLTNILAVGGLALITANQASGLHSLVKTYNIGLLVEAENQRALDDALHSALYNDFGAIKRNARSYAQNHIAIDSIMADFRNVVLNHQHQRGQ